MAVTQPSKKGMKLLLPPGNIPTSVGTEKFEKSEKMKKRSLSKNYLMVPKLTGCFPVMREARVGVQIGDT